VIDTIGSPWLAYAVLLSVTGVSRLRCGSWFAPAAFVGLVWSFFTGASLVVADYPVPGRGLWMLVVLIVAIQLGALLAHQLLPQKQAVILTNSADTFDSLIVPCRRYTLFCAAVALLGCIYFLIFSLEEFGLPFTGIGVLEVGAKWTLLRYQDAFEPWSVRLLIMWFHPADLLGGVLFACSRKRLDRTIGVLVLLPALLYSVLTGTRAPTLLGLTCWIGGFVATLCIRDHGRLALFTSRRLALLISSAGSIVMMFVSVDAVRDTAWLQDFVVDAHESHLSNYMFGSPAAFADWYAHADVSGAEWGARTFAGEFDLLHLKTRVLGRYLETSNVVGTESTNVYSLFRGLIEDFTAFGAVLVATCIGGLATCIYVTSSAKPRSALLWLSAFYATFLYSPIVSLFSFNGILLAWLVAWFVISNGRPRTLLLRMPPSQVPEASAL
jgi:oligosaccharide repeat unit polymerase